MEKGGEDSLVPMQPNKLIRLFIWMPCSQCEHHPSAHVASNARRVIQKLRKKTEKYMTMGTIPVTLILTLRTRMNILQSTQTTLMLSVSPACKDAFLSMLRSLRIVNSPRFDPILCFSIFKGKKFVRPSRDSERIRCKSGCSTQDTRGFNGT